MFKRTLLTALALTAAAFFSQTTVASADYQDTMRDFMPVIEDWANETQDAIEAVPAKPELACGDEMAQLGRNGFAMLSDLRGTQVPFDQAPTHTKLMSSVWMIAASAATVCGDDAQHMIETVQDAQDDLNEVIMVLAGDIQLR